MALFGITGHTAASAEADLPKPNIDLPTPKAGGDQTAVFAGGCFWCTEGAIEQIIGVKDVTSGYAGGPKELANYEAVCGGRTGHAEAIRITYDPAKVSYGTLLQVFFTAHDSIWTRIEARKAKRAEELAHA